MANPSDPSPPDRDGDDAVDLDELDRRAVALLVRDTLGRVAGQTDVTPRVTERPPHLRVAGPVAPSDTTTVTLGSTVDRPSGRWRWPVLAAAALLVVVFAAALVRSTDPATITETGPAATVASPPPPTDTEVPIGRDAWMAPSPTVADLAAVAIESSASVSLPPPDPAVPPRVTGPIGALVVPYQSIDQYQRTVTYRFDVVGDEPRAPGPTGTAMQVTAVSGVRVDPSALPLDTPTASSPTEDGIRWVDLQSRCAYGADGPAVGSWQLTPGNGCRRVVLAWTDDQVVVIDADPLLEPDRPLADVAAGLEVLTIDEVEARFVGVDGVASMRTLDETQRDAPDVSTTSMPPMSAPSSPWDPAVCPIWSSVAAHLDESGGSLDAGSYEDLLGLQPVAPPEIADDLDLLLQHAAESPAPPERADQLRRIAAVLDPTCGTS